MDVNAFCTFNHALYSYLVIYFMCMVTYVTSVYLYVFYVDLYFVSTKVDRSNSFHLKHKVSSHTQLWSP